MSRDLLLYWLPMAACVAIVLGGAYYMWRALFADQARGRRRCPRCWYDMAYSEGMTCSECGYSAQRESEFNRTRRHYGRAAVGLTLSVSTILAAYWNVADRGVIASLPTGVLITAMPVVNDSSSRVMRELRSRMAMDQVTEAQFERILVRAAKGDWMVTPPDDGWIRKYSDFVDDIRGRLRRADDDPEAREIEAHLLDIPPRVFLDTSDTWPKGARARIRVRARDWWPRGHELKLRITDPENPEDTRTIGRRPRRRGPNAYILLTDPLTENVTSATYEIEVFRGTRGPDGTEWESLSTRTYTLPINVSETWDTAIKPVESDELTNAMKRSFGRVTRWTGGPQPVRFNIRYSPSATEAFDGVAIGVIVELLHDGEVARQLDLWWLGGRDVRYRGQGHDVPFEDVPTLLSIQQADLDEHWKLRVRSDPELALRAGEAEKYWKGEFTIDVEAVNAVEQDVRPKPPGVWVDEGEVAETEDGSVAQ